MCHSTPDSISPAPSRQSIQLINNENGWLSELHDPRLTARQKKTILLERLWECVVQKASSQVLLGQRSLSVRLSEIEVKIGVIQAHLSEFSEVHKFLADQVYLDKVQEEINRGKYKRRKKDLLKPLLFATGFLLLKSILHPESVLLVAGTILALPSIAGFELISYASFRRTNARQYTQLLTFYDLLTPYLSRVSRPLTIETAGLDQVGQVRMSRKIANWLFGKHGLLSEEPLSLLHSFIFLLCGVNFGTALEDTSEKQETSLFLRIPLLLLTVLAIGSYGLQEYCINKRVDCWLDRERGSLQKWQSASALQSASRLDMHNSSPREGNVNTARSSLLWGNLSENRIRPQEKGVLIEELDAESIAEAV